MKRKIEFCPGEYYHLYSRGANKADIFENTQDRERFQKLLYLANGNHPFSFKELGQAGDVYGWDRGKRLVDIGAYCLMPNHFHLLIKEIEDGGISLFMRKLLTAYVMYFNTSRKRSGILFESRFKSSYVPKDTYLKYLFSYIHLNPVKIIDPLWRERGLQDLLRTREYLHGYKYSSFLDYMGVGRREGILISRDSFPEYFINPKEFSDYILEWLMYNRDPLLLSSGLPRGPASGRGLSTGNTRN